jgi:hypothetical protein
MYHHNVLDCLQFIYIHMQDRDIKHNICQGPQSKGRMNFGPSFIHKISIFVVLTVSLRLVIPVLQIFPLFFVT